MNSIFYYVQIVTIAVFLLVIVSKAIYRQRAAGINAIAVGLDKRGLSLAFEL